MSMAGLPDPNAFSVERLEIASLPDVVDLSDKIQHLVNCVTIADRASALWMEGDFQGAFVALQAYIALRGEFADTGI